MDFALNLEMSMGIELKDQFILGLCSLLVGHRSDVLPRDDFEQQKQQHDEEDQHQGCRLGLMPR